jgi:hypothetical protein
MHVFGGCNKVLGWLPLGKLWALSLSKRQRLVRPYHTLTAPVSR